MSPLLLYIDIISSAYFRDKRTNTDLSYAVFLEGKSIEMGRKGSVVDKQISVRSQFIHVLLYLRQDLTDVWKAYGTYCTVLRRALCYCIFMWNVWNSNGIPWSGSDNIRVTLEKFSCTCNRLSLLVSDQFYTMFSRTDENFWSSNCVNLDFFNILLQSKNVLLLLQKTFSQLFHEMIASFKFMESLEYLKSYIIWSY